jgi:hypothetical protein
LKGCATVSGLPKEGFAAPTEPLPAISPGIAGQE